MRSKGLSTASAILLFSLVLFPARAFAQETTGSLEGRALDSKGKPVGYAYVIVTGPSIQGKRGTVTTLDGRFVVLALPVGECDVRFAHVSYVEQVFEAVRIRLGHRTSMGDVVLEDKVYETQGVTVTGNAPPLIDPTSTEIGGTLTREDYEALPVDRSYRNITSLLPQANLSSLGDPVNFAGATGFENRYFVDGIDVTDSYRSTGGINLPYNFVEEVQVKLGGYEAEYRSSLGGVVNAVTYSGGNNLHGQIFGFFTNNAFTATPRSAPGSDEQGDFAVYDVGFGIGGPIRKDRLWFYAAYNPTFEQEDVEIPGFGLYEDWSTTHNFAGKITWKASDKNTLTLTGIGDPTTGRSVATINPPPEAVDPFLTKMKTGGLSFMIDDRHLIRENLLLEASLSWSTRDDDYYPETQYGLTTPLFVDSTGVQSGGGNTIEYVESSVILPRLKLTWSKGNHEIKTGLEYKDVELDFDITMWLVTENSATSYDGFRWNFKGNVGNRIPSAFVQDSWRLNEHLRLNAGIRWDGQYIIGSDGKVAQKILDQWQPRVGFTYVPTHSGNQKIFGSFARFYQELATAGAFWYFNAGNESFDIHWDHNPLIDPTGGDSLSTHSGTIQPENPDLEGQYFDEFTLGYERQVGRNAKLGVRGMYRVLRQGVEDGSTETGYVIGNPGSGALAGFADMKRDYSALELTYQQELGRRLSCLASYVLSETYGNYEGLFDSQYGNMWVNATGLFDIPDQLTNGEGLLPNDRTHVFKLSGSYRFAENLTLGAFGYWQSGTPLNEWGHTPPYYRIFLRQRGVAGRTPSTWDLNFRVTYQPVIAGIGRWRPKLIADFLHVGSEREPVGYDQIHYFDVDAEGNQTDPNPNYGQPTSWQPPMAIRLGAELQF